MGNWGKKWYKASQNNAYTRAQKGYRSATKGFTDSDDSGDDAARSEAAENQDPNRNRQRQGGSAQIDYYGTETPTT